MHFQDVHLRNSLEAERKSAERFAESERMSDGLDKDECLDCYTNWGWRNDRLDQPAGWDVLRMLLGLFRDFVG